MTWLPEPYLPVKVTDVLLAFPGTVQHLMPPPEAIPEEYWRASHRVAPAISTFIFQGYMPPGEFEGRDDIDYGLVNRHMLAIARSFEPKHEHKEATLRFLLDLWCPDIRFGEETA